MKKITRREFLVAAGAACTAAALTGCGGGDSSSGASVASGGASGVSTDGKTLRIAWSYDMQTMDVHKTSDNYSVPLNIFDRLFEIQLNDDGTTELAKSLVEDYEISEDGLTYSFTLRSGLVFSDGTPLTASDVEFTFTRMLALPESVQTDFAAAIAGADELMDGTADTLAGFEVVDDTHFVVTLGAPFAGFLYQLATPSCCIFSKANVESAGDDFGLVVDRTIGSGPYVITSWVKNSQVLLELNPNYWGEKPSVEHVIISVVPDPSTLSMMFQNGELDILDCDSLDSAVVNSTYKTGYADQMLSANRLSLTYLALNENVEPLNDVRVRRAIQMAIDRQAILDSVYDGNGSLEDGIYPHGLVGFSEENQGWLQYDPEEAKALLAEAGYPDGFAMELSADSSASAPVMLVLQIMQQNLEAVGIQAEIKSYDEASWLDLRKSGEMPSFVATWTADYNDPDNFIYTFFGGADKTKIRSLNYPDADVMKRVVEARAIVDDAERLAEYAALEKQIVREDAAWVPLFSRTHLFVLGENVAHYVPHWAGYSDFAVAGITLKG